MKTPCLAYLPCALAAVGLAVGLQVLHTQMHAYREAVVSWATRDLAARTQLAAESIQDALATGDFAHLHAFADARRADGLRLTVLSRPGGMVFDSDAHAKGSHADRPEVKAALATGEGTALRRSTTSGRRMLFCARRAGDDYIIRLGLPYETVAEPLRRHRPGLVVAGLVGASGILLLSLVLIRLAARNRRLAAERAVQERLLAETRRVADFRRDFIANVSHEIKTPLTGILGIVEVLGAPDADTLPAADRAGLLGMLRHESTRLDGLVRDILSLSRLEQETGDAARRNFAPADLADVLATAADRVRPRAEAAGVALKVSAPDAAVVPCDARLVEQAVVNLANNAVLHAGSPDVEISLSTDGARAVIRVVDHGVGLAPADRARVFERFYRVDKARDRERGGSGLGLAIVKHIAEIHGGDATVASVPGHGCTFSLILPKS